MLFLINLYLARPRTDEYKLNFNIDNGYEKMHYLNKFEIIEVAMFFEKTERKHAVRFPRNRHREQEGEDFFYTAYRSLSFIATVVIPALFTPAIIVSSLISHSVLFSLANIALALGYCLHFAHRLILKEISNLELFTSLCFLGALLAITFGSAPLTVGFSLIHGINFLSLVATSLNSFFLIRNFLVPPCQALIKYAFTFLGYDINTSFFSTENLCLKQDRFAIDRLLKKHYKHDSFSPDFTEKEIQPFNHLLSRLVFYINKYHEPLFGTLLNHDKIKGLEKAINDLTCQGNTDSSLAFINKKIDFKTTKINSIKAAIKKIQSQDTDNMPQVKSKSRLTFFKQACPIELTELDKELKRQEEKVAALRLCLPQSP